MRIPLPFSLIELLPSPTSVDLEDTTEDLRERVGGLSPEAGEEVKKEKQPGIVEVGEMRVMVMGMRMISQKMTPPMDRY